jgi:hypothetical protein
MGGTWKHLHPSDKDLFAVATNDSIGNGKKALFGKPHGLMDHGQNTLLR